MCGYLPAFFSACCLCMQSERGLCNITLCVIWMYSFNHLCIQGRYIKVFNETSTMLMFVLHWLFDNFMWCMLKSIYLVLSWNTKVHYHIFVLQSCFCPRLHRLDTSSIPTPHTNSLAIHVAANSPAMPIVHEDDIWLCTRTLLPPSHVHAHYVPQ